MKNLAWLSGSWEGMVKGSKVEEHWTTPVGSLMIGMGRQTTGDKTDFHEFMRLIEIDGEIAYEAIVGSQPAVQFRLTKLKEREAVFENPQHDYPKRFLYRLEGTTSIIVRVEGIQDGKEVADEYRLSRSK